MCLVSLLRLTVNFITSPDLSLRRRSRIAGKLMCVAGLASTAVMMSSFCKTRRFAPVRPW